MFVCLFVVLLVVGFVTYAVEVNLMISSEYDKKYIEEKYLLFYIKFIPKTTFTTFTYIVW